MVSANLNFTFVQGQLYTSKLYIEGCRNSNRGIMRFQNKTEVKIVGYEALGTCGNAVSKDPVLILSLILFLSRDHLID
jgi:hypothetical protein